MEEGKFALGLDFGTNSVRAVVVDISTGEEVGSYVHNYRRGEDGIITDERDPNVARQHPQDYIEGLETSVRGALGEAKKKDRFQPENIIGIGVDTTGSTPIPVDEEGQP
ncbi:ribulokinase, partial [bacterium]|nr:ribulokinase [bacterium]